MGLPAIKKWTVRHEMIVSLHIAGNSNKRIAAAMGITPERVSQVLSDGNAKALIAQVQKAMRLKMEEEIEDKLIVLAAESVDRLGETITHEFLPGTDEKAHQDRMAEKVLKGTGFLSKDVPEGRGRMHEALTPALAERLAAALEKADTAIEMRETAHEVPFAEVVEEAQADA
jgi:predicted transcriptional regulator